MDRFLFVICQVSGEHQEGGKVHETSGKGMYELCAACLLRWPQSLEFNKAQARKELYDPEPASSRVPAGVGVGFLVMEWLLSHLLSL